MTHKNNHPITLLVLRSPREGQAQRFERRLSETIDAATAFPGHLGTDIIRPEYPNRDYRILVRFASEEQLDQWLASPDAKHWLRSLDALAEKPAQFQRATGLERWFADPAKPQATTIAPPPRHKMALLTMLGAFPTIVLLLYALQPLLGHAPLPLRAAVLVPLMVLALTYAIMPWLSQQFATWLKPAQETK